MDRYKYRICFSKDGVMSFIGHLDLLRLFQRAIRRCGLPVAYSSGFNPHQLISFAMPLPIGHTSSAEYADIEFEKRPLISLLDKQLPDGLEIIGVRPLRYGERSAAALTTAAMYEIEFPSPINLKSRVNEILSDNVIIVEKKTKSGTHNADIRPEIISLCADGNTLKAMLSSGSAQNLKPELLVKYIFGNTEYNPLSIKYKRTEIFQTTENGYEPLIKR